MSDEQSKPDRQPLVPLISIEEVHRQNRAFIELIDEWVRDGDEEEQGETLAILMESQRKRDARSSRKPSP